MQQRTTSGGEPSSRFHPKGSSELSFIDLASTSRLVTQFGIFILSMLALLGEGWSVWRAAKKARPDKLKDLLAVEMQPRVVVNHKHPVRGITPLMAVVSATNTTNAAECVRVLIAFGADATAISNTKHKNTALHYAARNNKATAIGELLDAGANVFARNQDGFTALEIAWIHGRREAANALLDRIQLHCGWLDVSTKVAMPRWKRRWCVVVACDSELASVEVCVYHHPDQARPDEILMFSAETAIVVPAWSLLEFYLDNVKVQPLRQRLRKYSIVASTASTGRHSSSEYQREIAFASEELDEANDRHAWVSALKVCSSLASKRQIRQRRRPSRGDSQRLARMVGGQRSLSPSPSSPQSWDSTRQPIDSDEEGAPRQLSNLEFTLESPRHPRPSTSGHAAVCEACLEVLRQQVRQKQHGSCPVCQTPIDTIPAAQDSSAHY